MILMVGLKRNDYAPVLPNQNLQIIQKYWKEGLFHVGPVSEDSNVEEVVYVHLIFWRITSIDSDYWVNQ